MEWVWKLFGSLTDWKISGYATTRTGWKCALRGGIVCAITVGGHSRAGGAICFGVFELDPVSGELRKNGTRIRLQEQPFQVLLALVERPGEVVSREELHQRLWPDGTFVDFEDGLATAVRKVRNALGDDAANPRFVETLPKRGYRFLTAVERRTAASVDGVRSKERGSKPTLSKRAVLWAVATAGATLFGWTLLRPPRPGHPPVARLTIGLPAKHVLQLARPQFALSPDGSKVAYIASRAAVEGQQGLYLRDLNRFDAIRVEGIDQAEGPFFSPDSQWLAFSARGALWKVSTEGGGPIRIRDLPSGIRHATWTSMSEILFSPANVFGPEGIYQLLIDQGDPVLLAPAVGETRPLRRAQRLPGGYGVLVSRFGTGEAEYMAVSGDGEQRRSIMTVPDAGPALCVPTGHLVFRQSTSLMAAPFDVQRLRVIGKPLPALESLEHPLRDFAVADNGTLAYTTEQSWPTGRLVLVDRKCAAEPLSPDRRPFWAGDLSPDGRRLAIAERVGDERHIWVYDLENGGRLRLTRSRFNRAPTWTPDGQRIMWQSELDERERVVSRSADGSDGEMEVFVTTSRVFPGDVTDTGDILVANMFGSETRQDIWLFPLDGGAPRPFLQTQFREWRSQISPDGRWLAYESNESGEDEIYVRRFPIGGEAGLVSRGGGTRPRWSPDGTELFYRDGAKLMSAPLDTTNQLVTKDPRTLFEGPHGEDFFVLPDGRFVMIQQEGRDAAREIYVVLNWLDELTRLVPAH